MLIGIGSACSGIFESCPLPTYESVRIRGHNFYLFDQGWTPLETGDVCVWFIFINKKREPISGLPFHLGMVPNTSFNCELAFAYSRALLSFSSSKPSPRATEWSWWPTCGWCELRCFEAVCRISLVPQADSWSHSMPHLFSRGSWSILRESSIWFEAHDNPVNGERVVWVSCAEVRVVKRLVDYSTCSC